MNLCVDISEQVLYTPQLGPLVPRVTDGSHNRTHRCSSQTVHHGPDESAVEQDQELSKCKKCHKLQHNETVAAIKSCDSWGKNLRVPKSAYVIEQQFQIDHFNRNNLLQY